MPHEREQHRVRHEVLDRSEHRRRQDEQPDEPQRPRRVSPVQAVVVPADERQHEQHADAADGADAARARTRSSPYCVLEEEVGQHRRGEQPEPHRREGEDARVLSVLICSSRANAASIEMGAGFAVLDDLAEDVLLLELATRRLRRRNAKTPNDRDRDAEEQEGPPPPVVAAGERRRCRRRAPG